MASKTTCFMILVFLLGIAVPSVWAQENQIINSEFDEGLAPWGIYNYQNSAEGFTAQVVKDAELSGRNALELDIFDAPAMTSIGIAISGMVLEPGKTYPIGFTAKAEEARGMRVLLQGNINNSKWPTYKNTTVDLTTEPQEFVIDYTYTGGNIIGDDDTETVTLYLIIKWPYAKPAGYDLNSKVWIDRVYFGAEPPAPVYPKAGDFYPVNDANDVYRDVELQWVPGDNADTHNLYFGEVEEDVNAADTDSELLLSSGKTDTTYDKGILEYGKTYYWRVDEVNGLTVEKGDVWNFTIEPYSIPVTPISASASTAVTDPNDPIDIGPENTINGSGLDPNDHHATEPNTMWICAEGDTDPWIQFDFDKAYKLDAMQVWNANSELELIPGLSQGVKDVTISISMDGETWTALDGTHQFAQGEGVPTYAANTTIDFGNVVTQHVKINILNGWGFGDPYGLSEVRFLAVPTYAREPMPMDQGSGGKDLDVELAWRSGREAVTHEIYLGMDANDLGLLGTSDVPSYVAESLDYDQTYFWQIVEVNEGETPSEYSSDIWSFTTMPFGPVDDMESYEDVNGFKIWEWWLDGSEYGTNDPQNGSLVGADPSQDNYGPETSIVHGGKQSLPLWYNNTGDYLYSEAKNTRLFENKPQDWTGNGIQSLSLMFYGNAQNSGQLYVKINDTKLVYDGDPGDISTPAWQAWTIDLTNWDGDLQAVNSLIIGIEGADAEGVIYIDSIRVYPKAVEVITPVIPDTTNLALHLPFDGNYQDASDNKRHGTAVGDPVFVEGAVGQALELDGIDDYVAIEGYKGINADRSNPLSTVQQPFTIACWFKTLGAGEMVTWGTNVGRQRMTFRIDAGRLRVEHGAGAQRGVTATCADGEWHHAAVVVQEGATLTPPGCVLYLDGKAQATVQTSGNPLELLAGSDVHIGHNGPRNDRYFPGSLDDVRIYDRALSLAEIAGLSGRTAPIYPEF